MRHLYSHLNVTLFFFFFPFQDPRSPSLTFPQGSLPRNTRIAVPPDVSSPYPPQPIISRISIPPTSAQSRQRKPIPLSVIMRLQNPHWGAMSRVLGGEGGMALYQPPVPIPREFFHQTVPQQPLQQPPELRQPAVYADGKTHLMSDLMRDVTIWLLTDHFIFLIFKTNPITK